MISEDEFRKGISIEDSVAAEVEEQEIEGIGISSSLYFEIISPTSSKIEISGKTNIWGSDEYVRKNWGRKYVESRTNITNIEYFSKAKSFVYYITNLE